MANNNISAQHHLSQQFSLQDQRRCYETRDIEQRMPVLLNAWKNHLGKWRVLLLFARNRTGLKHFPKKLLDSVEVHYLLPSSQSL